MFKPSEQIQKNVQKSRLEGKILNNDLEEIVIEINKKEVIGEDWPEDIKALYESESFHSENGAKNFSPTNLFPDYIRVYITSSGESHTVVFDYYCRCVLPNEMFAGSDPMEALKAVGVAVKMYGMYRVYVPKYLGMNYDVKDSTADQRYIAGTFHTRTDSAIYTLLGKGLKNSSNMCFEAQHNANSSSDIVNSGQLNQNGAIRLANEGNGWFAICSYYYSYSDKSDGYISQYNIPF